jgi:5-methylcytosine-specific restriction protein A
MGDFTDSKEAFMFLDEKKCGQLLSEFKFDADMRNPPDGKRRGQFKAGWSDSTERCLVYNESTLKALTWCNLGYRLGKKFGPRDRSDIDKTFECFAAHYDSSGRVSYVSGQKV